jgi:hypothetical protein
MLSTPLEWLGKDVEDVGWSQVIKGRVYEEAIDDVETSFLF